MDVRDVLVHRVGQGAHGHPVQAEHLRRPGDDVGRDVELPAPDARHLLRLREERIVPHELLVRADLVGDVDAEHEDT